MKEQAFLVGIIDTTTGQLINCGIYSERGPTLHKMRDRFQIVLTVGYGKDYQEGMRQIKDALDTVYLDWVKPFMHSEKH